MLPLESIKIREVKLIMFGKFCFTKGILIKLHVRYRAWGFSWISTDKRNCAWLQREGLSLKRWGDFNGKNRNEKHFLSKPMHVDAFYKSSNIKQSQLGFFIVSPNVIISSNTVHHSLTPIILPGGYKNYSLFSSVLITPAALLINRFNLGELEWDVSQMKNCNMRLITPNTFSK